MSLNCIFRGVTEKTPGEREKLRQEIRAEWVEARRERRGSNLFSGNQKGAQIYVWQDPIVYALHKSKQKMTLLQIHESLMEQDSTYDALSKPEMDKSILKALSELKKSGRVEFQKGDKILREPDLYWLKNPADQPDKSYVEYVNKLAALRQ